MSLLCISVHNEKCITWARINVTSTCAYYRTTTKPFLIELSVADSQKDLFIKYLLKMEINDFIF